MPPPEFEVSFAREMAGARARRHAVLQSLFAEAHPKLKSGACLMARGSLARGDFCPYSDIDLVLLVPDEKYRRSNIPERLRAKVPYAVSSQTWLPSTPREKSGSLHVWFSVSQCRYLAGDVGLFVNCRAGWLELLARLGGDFLCDMYDSDPKRHQGMRDKASPFSHNVKRGRGGIVDYEFSRLVSLWLGLKHRGSPLQASLIRLSRGCFEYLFLLKSYLHETFKCSCESSTRLRELKRAGASVPDLFSEERILEIQDRHSRAVEVLKYTLKGG
jgi:UTP:GlnB (protein PII) uridylyltransferase